MTNNDLERQGDAYEPVHFSPANMPQHTSARDYAIERLTNLLTSEGFNRTIAKHAAEMAVDRVQAESRTELKYTSVTPA